MNLNCPHDFRDTHNLVAFLMDPPPEKRRMYQSMIAGLNTCPINHALRESTPVYIDHIREFWRNAQLNRQGKRQIESFVQNKPVVVNEDVIREVLHINDQPTDPVDMNEDEVRQRLPALSYEGGYAPLIKKLLHPYWRFLCHIFFHCMTGNKGGWDKLNRRQTPAFVALALGLPFNYSNFILSEMFTNLKKETFMQYPRFIQIIINAKVPGLSCKVNSLEVKPMNVEIFNLIEQSRQSVNGRFEGRIPLVKGGAFPEIEEFQDVIVNAVIAKEFVASEENVEDDDIVEAEPIRERAPAHASMVSEQLKAATDKFEAQIRIPTPTQSPASTTLAIVSDSDTGSLPRKRRRHDTTRTTTTTTTVVPVIVSSAPEEPIQVQSEVNPQATEATTTTIPLPPRMFERAPGRVNEGVSSSSARVREEEQVTIEYLLRKYTSKSYVGKGKNIEGGPKSLEDRVEALENVVVAQEIYVQDLVSELKNKTEEIVDLQYNLGNITVIVLGMRQTLNQKFRGDFPDTDDENNDDDQGTYDSASDNARTNTDEHIRTDDVFPESSNVVPDTPEVAQFGERLETDPRTEAEIKRGCFCCYRKKSLILKIKKTTKEKRDRAINNAPWYNPTSNQRGEMLNGRIVDQARKGFPKMKTVQSKMISRAFMRQGKRLVHKRLPATKKMASVLLMVDHRNGSLAELEFWTLNRIKCCCVQIPQDFKLNNKVSLLESYNIYKVTP